MSFALMGCQKTTTIGNPYVPEYFTLDNVTYHMESDNIGAKLEENEWQFESDGKYVTVFKDIEYQKNKTQKGYWHSEFMLVLKKDATAYASPTDYVIDNIIFENGKILVDFDVKGIKLNTIYEDAKRSFGDAGKVGYSEGSNMPSTLTYDGKTRSMVVHFESQRLSRFTFEM